MPVRAGLQPRLWLALGLLAGGIAAALQLVGRVPGDDLPPHAVARVGERLILRDEWLRAVASASAGRKTALSQAQQSKILDRLIDEELLVQHGLDLGLVQRDQRLRGQLVSEVLFAVTAERSEGHADDSVLRAFHAAHPERFATPGRLRLQAWTVDAAGRRQPFEPALPDAALPPAKVQAYLGPELTQQALQLEPGRDSAPLLHNGRTVVIRVLQREAGAPAAFEAVREQVAAEHARRADEAAVRELLAQLRQRHAVIVETTP